MRAESAAPALPPPLITGYDLRDLLHVPPGPIYRRVLGAVQDAQLEGQIRNREEALALARQIVEQQAPPPATENTPGG